MRVPTIGLPLDERRIVREGYRLAEQMLRNYPEPARPMERVRAQLMACRRLLQGASGRSHRS